MADCRVVTAYTATAVLDRYIIGCDDIL